ncbi:hypothetical protein H9L10_11680 [Phycicoccus endophyticus]|uniref:YtxH domain-containing protein n=1 Tax=Phycicoccus endophyticus TaxID=1690220 RepID=A0A7G9QZZ9_9MICO|nr:hypothetical protein [Phycicoccus endophyticus]NHI20783.1 hypothetical protein [Phycicoccus endophyticus]QNN48924.1 hypothetical protein H9L10_11680 [Phycicoccus endophyticus]GGL43879.1 hypothetical protein GCM10012283_28100 [Phycicoccus endophyticus]
MARLTVLAAAAAGYVLGARAGRERYDDISSVARRLWQHPRVQEGSAQAQRTATRLSRAAGRAASRKASEIAHGGEDPTVDGASSGTSASRSAGGSADE